MRAFGVTPAREEIGLLDRPEPELRGPSAVLLRTLEVGICGTDREIARFDYGTPPDGEDALVIGHESLAEVVEVGSEVSALRPGDLAVATVRRPCDDPGCRPCRAGRQDFCVTGRYTERGIKEAHGFMAELFVEEERHLNPVPAELRDVAVLVEPLTIAEKALEQVWQVQRRLPWADPDAPPERPGEGLRAVAVGAGPVALLGAMALRVRGFDVTVYSRSPAPNEKAALVEGIGASYLSSEETSVEELRERVGRIDLVYEAVGVPEVAFDVLGVLGANGVYVFTGVAAPTPEAALDTGTLMRDLVLGNGVALGVVNAGRGSFRAAIEDLGRFRERWPDQVRGLISGRHAMEEARELLLGRPGGIKHVVAVAESPP